MPSAVTKPALTRVGEADAEIARTLSACLFAYCRSTVVYQDEPDDHDSNKGEGTGGRTAEHLIDNGQPVSPRSTRAKWYSGKRFNG